MMKKETTLNTFATTLWANTTIAILTAMVTIMLGCSPKDEKGTKKVVDNVVPVHGEGEMKQNDPMSGLTRPVVDSLDSILSSMNERWRLRVEETSKMADSVWGEHAFGHSMGVRKEYYAKMIHLERKARNYADSVYPDWVKYQAENWDLFLAKKEEWVSKLRKTYGFTKPQTDSISIEAMLRDWPLPEVAPDILPAPMLTR